MLLLSIDAITSGQTPILSWFIWAFSPGSAPGTNAGPSWPTNRDRRGSTWPGAQRGGEGSSVPVDRNNRDRASFSDFLIFIPRQDFLFFSIYLFCVLYSIKWYSLRKEI